MNNRNNIVVYIVLFIFGAIGIWLTFFASNTSKYDSKVKAYRIDPNLTYDSEGNAASYYPIYYFKIDTKEYECKTKAGTGTYPNEKKNTVYYDSSDPTKCKTEYESSTSRLGGIVFLGFTALVGLLSIITKINDEESNNQIEEDDNENQIDSETIEKLTEVGDKIKLVCKRIVLGVIIVVLLVFTVIETFIFKQTIESKNYIETTATYVGIKEETTDEVFKEYIYVFTDKEGQQQKIIKTGTKEASEMPEKLEIRYNENNPQKYYDDEGLLDNKEMIWYIVKVVALVLLIILFFNKKLLNNINISLTVGDDD